MRIQIGSEYYFIDLVFYHRILKCHVILDLKLGEFEHGYAGQINTYLNYVRKHLMADGDNPPVGLLLCTGKDDALVEYALGGMDQQVFVSNINCNCPMPKRSAASFEKTTRNWPVRQSNRSCCSEKG